MITKYAKQAILRTSTAAKRYIEWNCGADDKWKKLYEIFESYPISNGVWRYSIEVSLCLGKWRFKDFYPNLDERLKACFNEITKD